MNIDALDHLVLTVHDLSATHKFYSDVLGMEVVKFGKGRTALRFGRQKINLHEVGSNLHPRAQVPTAGSGDLCFITSVPEPGVGKLGTATATPHEILSTVNDAPKYYTLAEIGEVANALRAQSRRIVFTA